MFILCSVLLTRFNCIANQIHAFEDKLSGSNFTWRDGDKRQVCHPSIYTQPSSLEELKSIVHSAAVSKEQVKVVGAGHSFSAITLTDDDAAFSVLVNLDKLNQVLSPPSDANPSVRVEAGMRIHNLNDYLLSVGFALENMGAIAMQSVAGATQTGTHGTGRLTGSMSSLITHLSLLLANGKIISASSTENEDVFNAARVGLGALGIIVDLTFAVLPALSCGKLPLLTPLTLFWPPCPR